MIRFRTGNNEIVWGLDVDPFYFNNVLFINLFWNFLIPVHTATKNRDGAKMTVATTETANRTESSPQLTEMGRLTLRGILMGVRRKISDGMTTAGIRNQNWSFKIGYKSILLVPSWTSQEFPS
ncbi:hypothetical protein WN943_029145 [Citrus x changshan-huyou]